MLAVFYKEKKLHCIHYSYLLLKSHLFIFSHSLCLFLAFSFRILEIAALALSYIFGSVVLSDTWSLPPSIWMVLVFETNSLVQCISVFLSEELMQTINSMAKSFSNGYVLVKKDSVICPLSYISLLSSNISFV